MEKTEQLESSSNVLGIKVEDLSWEQAFERVAKQLETPDQQFKYAFLNANNANLAANDEEYRKCLANTTVLPDGVGVDIAAKITSGQTFTANLNGTDFIPGLFVYIEKPITVALIGSTDEVVQHAAYFFKTATPWHNFVAISDGYFDINDSHHVLERLEQLKPDVVLVGMGTPYQEKWAETYLKPEHGKLIFTVGALFDFVSERVPRAPENWRNLRLEWVYRLFMEPKRLWRRYIIGNPVFIWRIIYSNIFDRFVNR